MKKILLTSLFLLCLTYVFGYTYLRVGDPRNSWWTDQGTIEEASLSVRPVGLYLEYGLYLTFSARGTYWTNPTDSLEVTLNFDLPEDAIVHDSWLWIGNDIAKAKIMDKWTASSIYENIVKRRRDPSILSKISGTEYELRIFPMAGNETRKVKITWLMPADWSKTGVSGSLPSAILKSSRFVPENFPVITFLNSAWRPKIEGDQSIQFSSKSDPTFGEYFQANIPFSKYDNVRIRFDYGITDGYFFSRSINGNEGVYQLAILPDLLIDSTSVRNLAILVDYDASNTTLSATELLNTLKNEMIANLNSRDSFNLMFSNMSIQRYSDKWVQATRENIEMAFSKLNNPLSDYSNLASLIGNGIDFVENHGNDGKIILVSDADQYGDYQVANKLITDILALMNPKIQFHISDYQSISFPYFLINGIYYQGNRYFYSNLSRITSGSYQSVANGSTLSSVIGESLKFTSGSLSSFDLHTSLQTGFCYGRYNLNGEGGLVYLNAPIVQVGKYKGTFPFTVEISGEFKNELFTKKIEIKENALQIDSLADKIWTGLYINELESSQQRNDVVNEIIFNSIDKRVLSQYTAFLCLENPNYVCYDCLDESELTGKDVLNQFTDSLKIFPNPFVDQLTVELNCSDPEKVIELAIYNLTGTLIYQFNTDDLQSGNNTLVWNGKDFDQMVVNSGVYLLVYKTNEGTKTIKLIKK